MTLVYTLNDRENGGVITMDRKWGQIRVFRRKDKELSRLQNIQEEQSEKCAEMQVWREKSGVEKDLRVIIMKILVAEAI